MTQDNPKKEPMGRRKFLREGLWGAAVASLGATAGLTARHQSHPELVWQIDPHLCTQCGKCATHCVLDESAVKCVQSYAICGYCDLCYGYLKPEPPALDTGAENELCPTGAIKRTFVEDPYFEYTIDESLCIGCAKCVEACAINGNGSFYLQVRHDRCVDCNECGIAAACPSGAFKRVPAAQPYLLKEMD